MPVSAYYGGKGRTVMENMKDEYGEEGGERVFYATANKNKKKGKGKSSRKRNKRTGDKR